MSNMKELILECQHEVLATITPNMWETGLPAEDMKALAYITGVHDMAQKFIEELCIDIDMITEEEDE